MTEQMPEIKFDKSELVREDVYTDQKIGSIRVLTPVDIDGNTDESRKIVYLGQTQVMTQAGPLPLNFDLEAESLSEAIDKFGDSAKASMEQTMKEIREYQREQASRIVVPGQEAPSKIQIP